MADPLDLFAIDKIVETAGCAIEPVISSIKHLQKIDEYYKTDNTVGEIFTDNRAVWLRTERRASVEKIWAKNTSKKLSERF